MSDTRGPVEGNDEETLEVLADLDEAAAEMSRGGGRTAGGGASSAPREDELIPIQGGAMSRLNDRARQLGETAAALCRGLDSADAGTGKDAELVFRTLQDELKIPPLEPKPGSARKT